MSSLRQASQIFFLILFLYVLIAAQGKIKDSKYAVRSPVPVPIFFAADPLVSLTASISSRQIVRSSFIPAAIIIFMTLIFGRFFCGWICPLGTTIDISDRLIFRHKNAKPLSSSRSFAPKYYILFGIIFLAILAVTIAGFFDPITILFRSVAFSIHSFFSLYLLVYSILGDLGEGRGADGFVRWGHFTD